MSGLHVDPGERGVVRVFAIDLPPEEAARFAGTDEETGGETGGDSPLRAALGADRLDPARIDVFPVKFLAGVGLSGYLAEGQGVSEAALAPDRARLDAVEGHVAVVPSAAFGGVAQDLAPRPPLTFLGAWPEERAAPPEGTLTADTARGPLAPGPGTHGAAGQSRVPFWAAILIALVVFGVVAALTW